MHINWRDRLVARPELYSLQCWPYIDLAPLSDTQRETFQRNLDVIKRAIAGEKLSDVATRHQLSSGAVSQILDRALGGDDQAPPALTSALVPHRVMSKVTRQSPIRVQDGKGCRAAFKHLLSTVDGLQRDLDRHIDRSLRKGMHDQYLAPKVFHQLFLDYLRQRHWPQDCYPFTAKNLAYEACRKYLAAYLEQHSIAKSKTKRAIARINVAKRAYEEVQIDEYLIDNIASVDIELQGQLTRLDLPRVSLIIAIDSASQAILAHQLCLTAAPSQYDILAVLDQLIHPDQPQPLRYDILEYPPAPFMPCHLLSDDEPQPCIGMIRLDNAYAHLAHTVSHAICEKMGATLNLGLPGQPKTRGSVEYAFKRLSDTMMRFKSTTGRQPGDPRRYKGKRPSYLTLSTLEDTIAVELANYNKMPQECLFGRSPIEILTTHVETLPIPVRVARDQQAISIMLHSTVVTVKSVKAERRALHVNFARLRYTGPGLSKPELLGQKVRLSYRWNDIREVTVYDMDGVELGTVTPSKRWRQYPLSLSALRVIQKHTRRQRVAHKDALQGLMQELKSSRAPTKTLLELVRIDRSMAQDQATPKTSSSPDKRPLPQASKAPSSIPQWRAPLHKDEHHE